MRYDHDDKVPFAATTPAPAVEVTAVSVSFQFLDLFKLSVLLQIQHRSACCRQHSQHSCCTSAADLVFADHGPQRCMAVRQLHFLCSYPYVKPVLHHAIRP